MPVDRRQLLMGGGAIVVLAAVYLWFRPSPPPPETANPNAGRTAAARPATGEPQPVTPIRLGALKTDRDEPEEAQRNPFRFQPKVVAPPPRPAAPPPTAIEAPRPAPVAPGPPPVPQIPLKLIGIVERANGVKWAVLSDGKSPPVFGKDGDIIEGRYTIVKIGVESIEMTHVDGRGRQVIRLTGQ